MCGRFSPRIPIPDRIKYFRLSKWLEYERRHKSALSQDIAVIRQTGDERLLTMMHWGLMPHWAEDVKIGDKVINARAETLAAKPAAFREPLHHRRCIIPASGFYEGKNVTGTRQPYFILRKDGAPLALAGLWERSENPAQPGEMLESGAIVTTSANALVAPLRHRMPAILEQQEIDAWFSHHQHTRDLLALLRPSAEEVLEFNPVSEYVNKPGNEGGGMRAAEGVRKPRRTRHRVKPRGWTSGAPALRDDRFEEVLRQAAVARPARAAARMASRTPGKRASRSPRRRLLTHSLPSRRVATTPALRRTLKWWDRVDLGMSRPKQPQAISRVPASFRTISSRTGSLRACSTMGSRISSREGCSCSTFFPAMAFLSSGLPNIEKNA